MNVRFTGSYSMNLEVRKVQFQGSVLSVLDSAQLATSNLHFEMEVVGVLVYLEGSLYCESPYIRLLCFGPTVVGPTGGFSLVPITSASVGDGMVATSTVIYNRNAIQYTVKKNLVT